MVSDSRRTIPARRLENQGAGGGYSPGRYGCTEIPALPPKEKTAGESEAKAESESAAEKPEAVEPVAEAVAAAETAGPAEELQTEPAPTAQTASSPLPARRRGRGRRGGRDHQRPNRAVQAQAQSQPATSPSEPAVAPPVTRATNEERASNTPPMRSLDSMAESPLRFHCAAAQAIPDFLRGSHNSK